VQYLKYEVIAELSKDEVEAAISRNNPDELSVAVLSAALYSNDRDWAEKVCIRFANYNHFNVRGNAILGFGHIARIHDKLTENIVRPLIEAALVDIEDYVRGQAESAVNDVEFFLKWRIDCPA
jgi:hypothetical protein